jgi:hypothetical protein
LRAFVSRFYTWVALEDPRIGKLHSLIREVIQLQEAAQKLIAELNEQLHRTTDTADDRPERRKKPRT